MPATTKRFWRGNTPSGVTAASDITTVTRSPTATPRSRARLLPSSARNPAGASASRPAGPPAAVPVTKRPTIDTSPSRAGSIPESCAARTPCTVATSTGPVTSGAMPCTPCTPRTRAAADCQSVNVPSWYSTSCGSTASTRSRSSRSKPFSTDSTSTSTAVPRARPPMATLVMNER